MSKLERRLIIFAIIFVVIYLGAAVLTIQSRISSKDSPARLESEQPVQGEEHLVLAELFLPMMILLAISVSFIIARKKRAKAHLALDDSDDEAPDPENK
jgi:heme/copper-type cytochrome/quinol oxidase subunit 2